jgi:phosphotransferase system  glucose/maltose/N-acetylglucosamine-specific IIC component
MRLHGSMTVNGRAYSAGDEIPGLFVYPFFLIHMLAFGLSGFVLAYSGAPVEFVFMHGGIAILVYTIFYLAIFGRDEVKWMFINAGLGLFGIVSQIDWILSLFGKHVGDFPWYVHVVPFLYFVLYTFLIRHALLDLLGARDDDVKRRRVEYGYIGASLLLYLGTHFIEG